MTWARSRIVPRPISRSYGTHVYATTHVLFDIINDSSVESRRVGIDKALFESIDNNARCGRENLDGAIEERTLGVDGNINVTCLIGVWISGTKTEFAEEVAARVSDTNE